MESITPEVIATHNLTPEEFNRIKELLGREPNWSNWVSSQ
jgi:phosphoribosylformylglycinamidine synthase